MEDTQTKQVVEAKEYHLSDQEVQQARMLNSQIVFTKAQYADTLSRVQQMEEELASMKKQRDGQKIAVDCMITRSSGWADAVAMARGDAKPLGFNVDFQNGATRIVRLNDANMG